MITPRRTRLVHAPDLPAFQRVLSGWIGGLDPWAAHATAVLVPTVAAGAVLSRTLDEALRERGTTSAPSSGLWAAARPAIVTRDQWYDALHRRAVPEAVPATRVEREVCMMAAAREASRVAPPPFKLRPGLAPAMLAFYDELGRHRRSVDAFERLLTDDLEPSLELDRGARRLLRQTAFLAATFRAYGERLHGGGRLDEHGLRVRLLDDEDTPSTFTRVVLAVGDHVSDRGGLWPADYDLLTRLPGLASVDVVATRRVLDAGLGDRLDEHLPGLEHETGVPGPPASPRLLGTTEDDRFTVQRDREEELVAVAREVKAARPDRAAVVVQRPLPYLYLARHVFDSAGIACRSREALPLAVEPFAAAVDAVGRFLVAAHDREATVALLASPALRLGPDDTAWPAPVVDAADRALATARHGGGRDALARVAGQQSGVVAAALDGAVRVADRLASCVRDASVAEHLDALIDFLSERAAAGPDDDDGRGTILDLLGALSRAHVRLDDEPRSFAETFALVRRQIEGRVARTESGDGRVELVEARAAAFGRYDDVFLVGLVDGEWPGRAGRNVFYPSSLLAPLGWPRERDLQRGARAHFVDLLHLARRRVSVSTIALEDDAVVTRSTLLEELDACGLTTAPPEARDGTWVTPQDALALAGPEVTRLTDDGRLGDPASVWLALRLDPPSVRDRSGLVGPRPPVTYAVSALETYLECPFKYLAQRVLSLGEDPIDEPVATPQRLGLVLHEVFETFFAGWRDAAGGCAIQASDLPRAVDRFAELAEEALASLPPVDRAVTRSWLLGSAGARGLAERLFVLEASRADPVAERLTEVRVDGRFVLDAEGASRPVTLRGVADRVDLFTDGTFRIVDYKSNKAPTPARRLQLALYARCLEEDLVQRRGGAWRAVEASYVAFGDPRLHVPLGRTDFGRAVTEAERRAVDVVDAIERGEFPVRPAELYRCNFCPYPTVCRKDYVGDD